MLAPRRVSHHSHRRRDRLRVRVIMLWLSRSITRLLNEAVSIARIVADGDLSTHITVSDRDEIGTLLGIRD